MNPSILELTQRFPPALGGVEQHVEHLASTLVRAGFPVAVSTSDMSRDRPFERVRGPILDSRFPVRRHRSARFFPAPHGLGTFAPGMLADALNTQAEVIHAHAFGYFGTYAAALARRLRRVRVVITPHSDEGRATAGTRLYAHLVGTVTLRSADRVIAQTNLEATRLRSLGLDPDRIVMIPTPIDLEEFRRPSEPRPPSVRTVVLYVGRLYLEQKGLDLLVRAFASLGPRPPAELRLVGPDWGGRARLEELARRLGVSDRMTITGDLPRPEILREYARADLFVLPSRFDSFPVVLLEAMASRLPILATRVGGVPEVVTEGENGLLVPPRDVSELARGLRALIEDRSMRERLGERGRRTVEAYSWGRLGPRYVAMFQELAHGR